VCAGQAHHAGKVGVQPIPVNLFVDKALQHAGPLPSGNGEYGRRGKTPPPFDLLAEREVRRGVSGNLHWIGFVLCAFVPCRYGVGAVRHVVDLEFAGLVRYREVGASAKRLRRPPSPGWTLPKQRHNAGVVELEGFPLTLGPCAQVVAKLLIAAYGGPKHIGVRRCRCWRNSTVVPCATARNVGNKHQALLVDGDVCGGAAAKVLPGDGLNIDNGLAAYSRYLAVNGAGKSRLCQVPS